MAQDTSVAEAAKQVEQAKLKTFAVEGVGSFVIRRPKNRDQIAIGRQYTIFSGGIALTDGLAATLVRAKAIVDVLAESTPDGFSFDDDDGNEQAWIDFVIAFDEWLRDVSSFRRNGTARA